MREQTGIADERERGQALPLVALLLWGVAGAAVLVSVLGVRVSEGARAQAGADAVALAFALDADAEAVARANGVLIASVTRRDDVDVVVTRGEVPAAARARTRRNALAGLHPSMQVAIRQAERLLGEAVIVVSGRRSRADQERLWAARHTNPYPVAPPGTSLHERGLAVDVPLGQAGRLAAIAALAGLCQPLPLIDPVHFTLCPTTPTR